MHVRGAAVVDFLGDAQERHLQNGCSNRSRTLLPLQPWVVFQGLAQGLLLPVRPPGRLPALGSHSSVLKVCTTHS